MLRAAAYVPITWEHRRRPIAYYLLDNRHTPSGVQAGQRRFCRCCDTAAGETPNLTAREGRSNSASGMVVQLKATHEDLQGLSG